MTKQFKDMTPEEKKAHRRAIHKKRSDATKKIFNDKGWGSITSFTTAVMNGTVELPVNPELQPTNE